MIFSLAMLVASLFITASGIVLVLIPDDLPLNIIGIFLAGWYVDVAVTAGTVVFKDCKQRLIRYLTEVKPPKPPKK